MRVAQVRSSVPLGAQRLLLRRMISFPRSRWPFTRVATFVRVHATSNAVTLTCIAFGFFNAFGNPARKDSVDYVVHLGDYIYEYAGDGDYGYGYSIGRIPEPHGVIFTLYDYRKRLATYRTDLDLLYSHQQFAWIPVWDDHGTVLPASSQPTNLTENRGCRQHLP